MPSNTTSKPRKTISHKPTRPLVQKSVREDPSSLTNKNQHTHKGLKGRWEIALRGKREVEV